MDFQVFTQSPIAVQIHIAAALPALVLGPVAIWRRQRDGLHRAVGRAWVLAMIVLAGSSFFITEARHLGPFSIIHLLSLLTLAGLWQGIRAIRRGDVVQHLRTMRALYVQALILAGVFTFLPGRRMNSLVFGDAGMVGFAVAAGVGGLILLVVWREMQPARARRS